MGTATDSGTMAGMATRFASDLAKWIDDAPDLDAHECVVIAETARSLAEAVYYHDVEKPLVVGIEGRRFESAIFAVAQVASRLARTLRQVASLVEGDRDAFAAIEECADAVMRVHAKAEELTAFAERTQSRIDHEKIQKVIASRTGLADPDAAGFTNLEDFEDEFLAGGD